MASITIKRFIAGAVGLLYAVVYGFWTLIATGGGHVNFIWIFLFVSVGFLGLYYPVMAVMTVDLRSRVIRLIFGCLIGFYLLASTIMIVGWMKEPATDRASDYSRALQANGIPGILFCAFFHFLPTIIFAFFLTMSIFRRDSRPEEEMIVNLKLS